MRHGQYVQTAEFSKHSEVTRSILLDYSIHERLYVIAVENPAESLLTFVT
jgi:hypothetical protein